MTKRTRTVLFAMCLFLFLTTAPIAIFYSQGYRIDFENKKITQTGGLFLKVEPKQAEIYINGKLVKRTDFFFGSALIENLLPRKYKIEIKKAGFSPWQKHLEVREKEVTEAKNIVLFPENINFNILTPHQKNGGGVGKLWFSPDEKKIILYEEASPEELSWSLKLYDLEKNLKSHLIDDKNVNSKGGAELLNLEFSSDSKEIYLDIGLKEKERNFLLKLDKVPPVLTEMPPQEISSPDNIIASQTSNGKLYLLDGLGQLFKNGERLTQKPFPVKSETEYALEIFQDFIFLREGQTLYKFNPDSKSFEKFFDDIKDLKISPDNKKLVYFSDSEIWLFFLKDVPNQPKRKVGEKVFLIRLSEKIGNCLWLNPEYLIFNTGNKIKIAEIDDRDRINIVDIGEYEGPEIFFSQNSKKIYILSNGSLYEGETLL